MLKDWKFKDKNERLKAEEEKHESYRTETTQRVEILSNALKIFRDHIKDIDERVLSCNLLFEFHILV